VVRVKVLMMEYDIVSIFVFLCVLLLLRYESNCNVRY